MAHYVLEYRYVDAALRASVRPRHVTYLQSLFEQGRLVMAGPIGAPGAGAMVVYRADSEAEAQQMVDDDPYTVEGVIADRVLREWTVVIPQTG